jgi:hypothetical protein
MTLTSIEAFDKFFSTGLSSYPGMYDPTTVTVRPIQRPDLGMTYDAGIIVRYGTLVTDGLDIEWPYTIDQASGTRAAQIEGWILCRAWRNAFAQQTGNLIVPVNVAMTHDTGSFGSQPISEVTVKLHPARGWQLIRVRHLMLLYTQNVMHLRIQVPSNVSCPYVLVDSWGYDIIL